MTPVEVLRLQEAFFSIHDPAVRKSIVDRTDSWPEIFKLTFAPAGVSGLMTEAAEDAIRVVTLTEAIFLYSENHCGEQPKQEDAEN